MTRVISSSSVEARENSTLAEVSALHHQLGVLERQIGRPTGDRTQAKELLTEALKAYQRVGMPRHVARTQEAAG